MKRLLPFLLVFMLSAGIIWAQSRREEPGAALHNLMERGKEGEPKALYELGRLYETGYDSLARDSVLSLAFYMAAADSGYPPAMNILGFRYYNGDGLRQDKDSAIFWIREAAEAGDATAASNLGYLFSLEENFVEAEKWLTKAGEAGVPSALSQLGDLKRMGKTGDTDTLAAVSFYEKAIEGGDWDSQFKLLAMMGYKWQDLTAEEALGKGIEYYSGNAPVAGVELLEIASRKGEARATALLGDAYSRGIGVEYNPRLSLEYFHRAAVEGYAPAQLLIAELLDFYPDEFEESADFWREKALEEGISDAEKAYEMLFEKKEHSPEDKNQTKTKTKPSKGKEF